MPLSFLQKFTYIGVLVTCIVNYPQTVAYQQICHTAAEGQEFGRSLAGWFCLRVFPEAVVKLSLRPVITSRIHWGWKICLQAPSHDCQHTLVLSVVGQRLRSSPVGFFRGLPTTWQLASPRAKGESEREPKRQATAFYK